MTNKVLEFNQLYKSFAKDTVLKGIDAEVKTGEVIGLLGLNGAGKTTLLETALGFCKANAGSSKVFGVESSELIDKATKIRIGFVPQQDELLDNITGKSYLDLISGFYEGWNHALIERLCVEWLVPLDTKIQKLSVGQRQKLSILSALGHEPELIILDEPVASLDPVARRQFLKELVDIASSQTRTILFSTHIVSDLERVASRVWLIKEGKIEIDEALDSLKEHSARIHLPPGVAIPSSFLNDDLIHHRSQQNSNTLIFRNWSSEQHARLEQESGEKLTPERLSLEDIFLEVHV